MVPFFPYIPLYIQYIRLVYCLKCHDDCMLLTFWGRTGGHLCDSNRWWTEWTEERVIINTLKHNTVCVYCTSVFVCELTWVGKVQFWYDLYGAHLNNKGWDKHYLGYADIYVDIYMRNADTSVREFCCVLAGKYIYMLTRDAEAQNLVCIKRDNVEPTHIKQKLII